jgi:hypothetical protein
MIGLKEHLNYGEMRAIFNNTLLRGLNLIKIMRFCIVLCADVSDKIFTNPPKSIQLVILLAILPKKPTLIIRAKL